MKTKFIAVAVALLALTLCGTAMLSYAQEPAGPPPDSPGFHGFDHGHGPMGFMFRELNLTDAQKQQVKTMMQAQRTSLKPLHQQLAQTHLAMLQATAGTTYDQVKVAALATQQSQLEAQMTVARESLEHQIYVQVLTSDQRAKADELRTQQISRETQHLQKMSQAQAASTTE